MVESDLSISESTDLSTVINPSLEPLVYIYQEHMRLYFNTMRLQRLVARTSQQLGQHRARCHHGVLFQRPATARSGHRRQETPHAVLPLGHRAPMTYDSVLSHDVRESQYSLS